MLRPPAPHTSRKRKSPKLGGGTQAAQKLGTEPPHTRQCDAPNRTHQLLGSANAEMTPARAPAAAADRKQQPDATCEGKNG